MALTIFGLGLIVRALNNWKSGQDLTLEAFRSLVEALNGGEPGSDVRRALVLVKSVVANQGRPSDKALLWAHNVLIRELQSLQDGLLNVAFESLGVGQFLELTRFERVRKVEELRNEKASKLRSIALFCRDANNVRQELYYRDFKPGVDLGVSENSTLPEIRARHAELLKLMLEEIGPLEKWLKVTKSRMIGEGRAIAENIQAEFELNDTAPLEHLEVALSTLRAQRDEKARQAKEKRAEEKKAKKQAARRARPEAPEGAKENAEARFALVMEEVFAPREKFHGVLAQMSANMAEDSKEPTPQEEQANEAMPLAAAG